jgi:hypothetical protein
LPLAITFLLPVIFAFSGSAFGAGDLDVFFKTSPRVELLRPFADPIDLSLLVTRADGKPVRDGSVAIRLDAPARGRIFTTDYPLVEGTVLNEMRLPLRQGKVGWKYLFPIRGEYDLNVDVTTDENDRKSTAFRFTVRENRQKWFALGGFSAALFLVGFIGGRVFTKIPAAASLLISVALFNALTGHAHVAGQSGASVPGLEIEPATVGKASLVRWTRPAGAANPNASLTLSITHLEKQKVVFAVEKLAVAGEWSMKFHFPDGAEYRVVAISNAPGEAPVRSEQVIAVTGVEPPLMAMVPALSYFLALIALGLFAGRWSKMRTVAR